MVATVHVTAEPFRPPEKTDRWQPLPRLRSATMAAPLAGPGETDPLLVSLHAMPVGDPARAVARDRAIEWYLPMAGHLARRFRNHSEPLDDITQAAVIGLIKAIDRYDPGRGVPFVSFAFPTVLGEIRRHFRDATWDIRVPRRIQELYRELAKVTDQLTRELQRSPSTVLVAQRLGVSEREVGVVRLAAHSYRLLSLDQPRSDGDWDGDGDGQLADLLGVADPALTAVENRMLLRHRLSRLSERDRRIILMRFDAELTQAQIAAELGVSQMHISRLLSRTLSRLRLMR
ncbi:SigB/SigF/SigG family RNA polymerase sigma factor [Catellatospora sichuanensis]|uniref:SigB/SigF/SigG family RNA polymerase sigma factor n=1 Tax=Catellatospora sichuanensis TaxID=1969805 RepID=UPI001182FBDD|nr:SigB/SigF/SigG family RNA polymerase sigma factor [Catellatospora sichuanensis]